jgi:hypothetical protein
VSGIPGQPGSLQGAASFPGWSIVRHVSATELTLEIVTVLPTRGNRDYGVGVVTQHTLTVRLDPYSRVYWESTTRALSASATEVGELIRLTWKGLPTDRIADQLPVYPTPTAAGIHLNGTESAS